MRWTFTSGSAFWTGPAVVDGVAYIGDLAGHLWALRTSDGSVLWKRDLTYQIMMTPVLYDGTLFVGTHSSGGVLYAFNPKTGEQLWKRTVLGGFRGSPVAINGTLFIPTTFGDAPMCEPDGVLTFNEKTGDQGLSWLTEATTKQDGGGFLAH